MKLRIALLLIFIAPVSSSADVRVLDGYAVDFIPTGATAPIKFFHPAQGEACGVVHISNAECTPDGIIIDFPACKEVSIDNLDRRCRVLMDGKDVGQ